MRICIVQLGRIGDLILLTPMLVAIKNKYPDCQIDFLVGPSNYPVIKDNPLIERVIINKKTPFGIISTLYKLLTTN